MSDAISYKRFSSPVQAAGDSQRRQADLTDDYCRRRGLTLIDTYLDPGVSGFTGANLGDGSALRALLNAAQAGRFRPGTHLIVESLDRLSRAEMSVAVRLFLDILETGLIIVTLVDDEQVFTKDRVDNDMTAIVIAIILLMRANNESRVKRERALQSHKARRAIARESRLPITKRGPPWLVVEGSGDARRFVVDKKRARIVRQIFKLYLSGLGQHRLVDYLNRRHVPTFTATTNWRGSMVSRLLRSQAVFGIYQPCFKVVEDGRARRVPDAEGPIEDYYPAILNKDLFDQVERARASRCTTRSGARPLPKRTNLFSGLGHCAICGSGLYLSQSANGYSYLKCAKGYDWACSNRLGFAYRKLETVFLALDDLFALVRGVSLLHRSFDGALELNHSGSEGAGGIDGGSEVDRPLEIISEHRQLFNGFRGAKALLASPALPEALEARTRLLNEVRRFFYGAVLHPNRVVTLHMKADADGSRVALVVGTGGLEGIQITAATGEVGFIGGAICQGLVRPVSSGITKTDADKLPWRQTGLDDVLASLRVICSANGDWQAIIHNPTQAVAIIARAETSLANRQ